MPLFLDAHEDIFHVVQTAHEARPEVEAPRTMGFLSGWTLMERPQPRAQRVIDDRAERAALPLHSGFELRRHIVIQRKRGAHDVLTLYQ